jgi:NADH:ubiquinone oxidoreductase subunit 2 (subunit N)
MSYILSGFTRRNRQSSEASLKYVIYGGVASGVMLYGMSLVYGNTGTPSSTFGQFVAVGTASTAIPAFANIDPPRMFQISARLVF